MYLLNDFYVVSILDVASWREGGSSLNRSGGTGTGEGEASPNREKEGGGKGGGGGGPGPGGMVPPMGVNGGQGVPPMVPGPVPPHFRGMMPPYVSVISFLSILILKLIIMTGWELPRLLQRNELKLT